MSSLLSKRLLKPTLEKVERVKANDTIIDEVLDKYKEKAALNSDLTYDNYKNNSFYIEELADNIMLAKEAVTDRSQTSDFRKIEFYPGNKLQLVICLREL